MNPKTLYIFTPGFAAKVADSTCIPFLQQFCISIKQVSPETPVVIFAFQYPSSTSEYEWNGIRVIPFGGNDRKGISRIVLWLKVCYRFYTMRKEASPSGIFSIWLTECTFIGKIIAGLFSLKHYTWIVGQDARPTNRYVKLINPGGEQLIAFSAFIQQLMAESFGINPRYIIRNGVNPGVFPELNTSPRKISVVGVASLIPLKNFKLFIEIIEQVNKHGLAIRAVIIGEGPEEENLEKLIKEKKLQNIIEFAGLQEHQRTLELMNQSRILLHTSEYDSNASVLHEALYAGCTVISTCPIDPDNAENFYLLTDKEEMIKKVIEVLSVPEKGYRRVTTNTMNQSAEQVLKLFY